MRGGECRQYRSGGWLATGSILSALTGHDLDPAFGRGFLCQKVIMILVPIRVHFGLWISKRQRYAMPALRGLGSEGHLLDAFGRGDTVSIVASTNANGSPRVKRSAPGG